MNYHQRLNRIEGQMGAGAKMSFGEFSKAFVMWTFDVSGDREGSLQYMPYEYPGSKPLFEVPFTLKDWEWYDSIKETLAQEIEIRQRRNSA
jgi:hypothetical protein